MPNTYTELRQTVVGTATPSVTFDISSVSGYTDLVVIVSARSVFSAAEVAGFIRVGNGSIDTGSNYSRTRLLGTGSAASSARGTNLTAISWDAIPAGTSAAGTFGATIIQIMNYSNTTTNKTILIRSNEPNNYVAATVGLWRSTSAINQIQIYGDGGANLAVGTTVSLYGIANADLGAAKATGGIITEDSQYWYHTFGASGTFTPKQALTVDYLVVAGGGGGTAYTGGGGAGGLRCTVTATGGGGALESPLSLASGTPIAVTVGGGGTRGTDGTGNSGSSGSNSIFSTITSTGGGGGGGDDINGLTGGSGGGGGDGGNGGNPTTNQGYAGGNATNAYGGGGGGGAGQVGAASWNGTTGTRNGGNGVATIISGTSVTYGGGGGGGFRNGGTQGLGGTGGGGNGGIITGAVNGSPGTPNTGGGGGGGNATNLVGGNGGSGIVIVRYAK